MHRFKSGKLPGGGLLIFNKEIEGIGENIDQFFSLGIVTR